MERVIRVSVAVSSGAVPFRVEVRAASIEEAVRLAAVSYPGGELKVLFPIDPESFFAEEAVPAEDGEVRDLGEYGSVTRECLSSHQLCPAR